MNIDEYMQLPYTRLIQEENDETGHYFYGKILELDGCQSTGDTLGQMPRPVKGSGLAKGSCPIQFQRLTACPCGPNVSLPHYAFACIPRYRGLRLHRRAIDRARLFTLSAEADKMPVS